MQLEDYFEFEKFQTPFGEAERIRIKGHRIGIETVVNDWKGGYVPEQIVARYPTLNLEKVFATLTYYLQNKDQVEAYIKQVAAIDESYYLEYLKKGPGFLKDPAMWTAQPTTGLAGQSAP
jgi:uncharacterized protein (DUF433 family)